MGCRGRETDWTGAEHLNGSFGVSSCTSCKKARFQKKPHQTEVYFGGRGGGGGGGVRNLGIRTTATATATATTTDTDTDTDTDTTDTDNDDDSTTTTTTTVLQTATRRRTVIVIEGFHRKQMEQCAHCGTRGVAESIRRCTGCHVTRYCSRDCQKGHWSRHKAACKKAKRSECDDIRLFD